MFCSTIIPTVNRPSLTHTVASILEQKLAEDGFEVIVVNDSGQPLPDYEWRASPLVTVLNTNRRERSVARNSGAAVGRGKYLHFIDDDDWLLPGALQAFWSFAQTSQADWLYGATQLVDREQQYPYLQLRQKLSGNCFSQVMAGEWIPLQSSLIRAEVFFTAGGFSPALTGTEDIDLCRRIALRGDLAFMDTLVACIQRGREGSTTPQTCKDLDRQVRDKILDQPGVLARLQASASSAYWKGKMIRLYLSSCLLNLQHKRVMIALSRAAYGAASLFWAIPALFSPKLWQAVLHEHTSITFWQ